MTARLLQDFASLEPLGWDDERARELALIAAPKSAVGRVSRIDRRCCTVLTPTPVRAGYQGFHIATGDWVVMSPGPGSVGERRVVGLLARRSAFLRRGAGAATEAQVVAANVDRALLVHALDRELNPHALQRYLALAWDSGARPVVVLSKADCRAPNELRHLVELAARVAGGAGVVTSSTVTGDGLQELRDQHLKPGLTVALIGPSGAGKSSLVNALTESLAMPTGAVRSDGKGRHTTTHRELLVVPGGGILLDTPGMRSVGLWLQNDGLEVAFAEVERLAADCKFRDCAHRTEPGCAVSAAVAAGTITSDRVLSWQKLKTERAAVAAKRAQPGGRRKRGHSGKAGLCGPAHR